MSYVTNFFKAIWAKLTEWWTELRGWRTFLFNGVLIVLAVIVKLYEYLAGVDWIKAIETSVAPWIVIFAAMVNVGLRQMTTTPPATKIIVLPAPVPVVAIPPEAP